MNETYLLHPVMTIVRGFDSFLEPISIRTDSSITKIVRRYSHCVGSQAHTGSNSNNGDDNLDCTGDTGCSVFSQVL
jgi:hypothetical protein